MSQKQIIIVDDDKDLLQLLTLAFESKGFKVIGFEKGSDALKAFHDQKILRESALLILDRLLPDMDGLDILKQLNKEIHLPVLILSVLSAEKDVLEGLSKGAVDYVTKPFSLPILMAKAQRLMG